MFRSLILSSVVALLVAGQAHAGDLVWPTICSPAYTAIALVGGKPTAVPMPAQCVKIAPNTDHQAGGTIYDPQTGFRVPPEVEIAWEAQDDAASVFGHALGPFNAGKITLGQLNELAWIAASIEDRDPLFGIHEPWAPLKAWAHIDRDAPTRCGPRPSPVCRSAFEFAARTEFDSNGVFYERPGLSKLQLEAIFQVLHGEVR